MTTTNVNQAENKKQVLMVLTSHDQLGDTGEKTGFWLEEFAAPYYQLRYLIVCPSERHTVGSGRRGGCLSTALKRPVVKEIRLVICIT